MGFAIGVTAENDSAIAIRALWHRASEFELAPSMAALNYPPHITFAIFDDLPRETALSAAERVFADQEALHLTFRKIAYFDGNPLILWAAPDPFEVLQGIHDEIHRAIDRNLCREHYRPGIWVPHCSLAVAVDESHRARAIEFAQQPIEPFEVTFEIAEVVSFPPLASAGRWSL